MGGALLAVRTNVARTARADAIPSHSTANAPLNCRPWVKICRARSRRQGGWVAYGPGVGDNAAQWVWPLALWACQWSDRRDRSRIGEDMRITGAVLEQIGRGRPYTDSRPLEHQLAGAGRARPR